MGAPPAPAQASPDPAVGGGDHPVRTDEGAPTEVEAGASLRRRGEGESALPLLPEPSLSNLPLPRLPLTCRDTCQGQEPGTASSPLTILDRPLSTGSMVGTPQPEGQGQWLVSGWCPKGVRRRLSTSRPLWHPGTQSFVRCKEFSPPPVQLTAALRRRPCGRSPRLRVSGVGAQAPQPALCPEGSVHATVSPGFCPGGSHGL